MIPKTHVEIVTEVDAMDDIIPVLNSRITQAITLLERTGSEMCIRLVNDVTIQKLHLDYMDDDSPTDVLSFEQDVPPKGKFGLLGDVVISVETAKHQAHEKKWSLEEEVLYLALHGLLHLLGYDHAEPDEEKIMFGLQHELFETVFHS